MIDTSRQVELPTPSTRAWLIGLDSVGPQFVVFRIGSASAPHALADHLVEIGAFPDTDEARVAIDAATISSMGVV